LTSKVNKSNLANDEIGINTTYFSETPSNNTNDQYNHRTHNTETSNKGNNLELNQYLIDSVDGFSSLPNLENFSNSNKSDTTDQVSLKSTDDKDLPFNNITCHYNETSIQPNKFDLASLSQNIINEKSTPHTIKVVAEITNDLTSSLEMNNYTSKQIKQSPDNISKKEIINSNYVSVGVNTVSLLNKYNKFFKLFNLFNI
jgi:hypothetical protein